MRTCATCTVAYRSRSNDLNHGCTITMTALNAREDVVLPVPVAAVGGQLEFTRDLSAVKESRLFWGSVSIIFGLEAPWTEEERDL